MAARVEDLLRDVPSTVNGASGRRRRLGSLNLSDHGLEALRGGATHPLGTDYTLQRMIGDRKGDRFGTVAHRHTRQNDHGRVEWD